MSSQGKRNWESLYVSTNSTGPSQQSSREAPFDNDSNPSHLRTDYEASEGNTGDSASSGYIRVSVLAQEFVRLLREQMVGPIEISTTGQLAVESISRMFKNFCGDGTELVEEITENHCQSIASLSRGFPTHLNPGISENELKETFKTVAGRLEAEASGTIRQLIPDGRRGVLTIAYLAFQSSKFHNKDTGRNCIV